VKRTLYLIKTDFLSISREGTLLIISLAPLLVIMLLRMFLPMIENLLMNEKEFDLSEWYPVIFSFFIQFPPMLLGMAMGYVLLDERDENILEFVSVTPAGKLNFLLSKMMLPLIMSVIYVCVLIHGTALISFPVVPSLLVAILSALQGPMLMLALASMASNKIEGLAVGKMLSIIFILPVVSLFLPGYWGLAFVVLPGWWVMKEFLTFYDGSFAIGLTYFIVGLFVTAIYNVILFHFYNRKIG